MSGNSRSDQHVSYSRYLPHNFQFRVLNPGVILFSIPKLSQRRGGELPVRAAVVPEPLFKCGSICAVFYYRTRKINVNCTVDCGLVQAFDGGEGNTEGTETHEGVLAGFSGAAAAEFTPVPLRRSPKDPVSLSPLRPLLVSSAVGEHPRRTPLSSGFRAPVLRCREESLPQGGRGKAPSTGCMCSFPRGLISCLFSRFSAPGLLIRIHLDLNFPKTERKCFV